MKKAISFVVAMALAAAMCVVSAADVTLSADATDVKVGDTVTVTVTADGLASIDFAVDYDDAVLEFVKATADSSATIADTSNPDKILIVSGADYADATICTLEFTAIAAGETDINVVVNDSTNAAAESVDVTTSAATVTVAADETSSAPESSVESSVEESPTVEPSNPSTGDSSVVGFAALALAAAAATVVVAKKSVK